MEYTILKILLVIAALGKEKRKGKGKGRWKEDSLRKVGRTH